MYGMVHRALRQMLLDDGHEAGWLAIERELGIGPAELISASVYEDTLTLDIVAAAARVLGGSVADTLRALGRYWVHFVEGGSYGAIMDFVGTDLAGFLDNLDRMHTAVVVAMPAAIVPSFRVLSRDIAPSGAGTLTVRYRSPREGLEPLATGLLEGLLARFALVGRVEHGPRTEDGVDFYITYAPQGARVDEHAAA